MFTHYYTQKLSEISVNDELKRSLALKLFTSPERRGESPLARLFRMHRLALPAALGLVLLLAGVGIFFTSFSKRGVQVTFPSQVTDAKALLALAQEFPLFNEGDVLYVKAKGKTTVVSSSPTGPKSQETSFTSEVWTDGHHVRQDRRMRGEELLQTKLALEQEDGSAVTYTYAPNYFYGTDNESVTIAQGESEDIESMPSAPEVERVILSSKDSSVFDSFSQGFAAASSLPGAVGIDEPLSPQEQRSTQEVALAFWPFFNSQLEIYKELLENAPDVAHSWITSVSEPTVINDEIIDGERATKIEAKIELANYEDFTLTWRGWVSTTTKMFVREEMIMESGSEWENGNTTVIDEVSYDVPTVIPAAESPVRLDLEAWKKDFEIEGLEVTHGEFFETLPNKGVGGTGKQGESTP